MGYVSGALQFADAFQSYWAAGSQKRLDRDKVKLKYEVNLEKIRRREFMQEKTKGLASARSQASGVTHKGGSTAKGYLTTMAREFKSELDWMKKFGEEQRRLGIKQSSIDYQARSWEAAGKFVDSASTFSAAGV